MQSNKQAQYWINTHFTNPIILKEEPVQVLVLAFEEKTFSRCFKCRLSISCWRPDIASKLCFSMCCVGRYRDLSRISLTTCKTINNWEFFFAYLGLMLNVLDFLKTGWISLLILLPMQDAEVNVLRYFSVAGFVINRCS